MLYSSCTVFGRFLFQPPLVELANARTVQPVEVFFMPTTQERFWKKVNKTAGCWLWTASKTLRGYGQFAIAGRNRGAHLWAYEFCVGDVKKGLELDHLCRVRHCVNPDHLEAVTHRENVRRGDLGKINAIKTRCPRGHEYNGKNTYHAKTGRVCRICMAAFARGYRRTT